MNDACGDYRDVKDFPIALVTTYTTNCLILCYCSQKKHQVIEKFYVEVKALYHIPPNHELFAKYGKDFWSRPEQMYQYGKDPKMLVGETYEKFTSEFAASDEEKNADHEYECDCEEYMP